MRGQRVDQNCDAEGHGFSALAAGHLEHVVLDLFVDALVLALLVEGHLVEVLGSRAELLVVVVGQVHDPSLLLQSQAHDDVLLRHRLD